MQDSIQDCKEPNTNSPRKRTEDPSHKLMSACIALSCILEIIIVSWNNNKSSCPVLSQDIESRQPHMKKKLPIQMCNLVCDDNDDEGNK